MPTLTSLYRTAAQLVPIAGKPVVVMYGPVAGGFITNPANASDQGLPATEILYVDPTGAPAALAVTETTIAIQPGQSYFVTPGQTTNVTVNAVSAGHRFSGVVYQPPTPFPPAPQPGTFPPSAPTTLTKTIPSYLYEEYADDEALQAFVDAYNNLAQQYVTWFATISLPVYTNAAISGPLLDWIAQGIYGMIRPSLSSGKNRDLGPLNTYQFNVLPYNKRKNIGPTDITVTSDDIFKRIMTWNFSKVDSNTFNIRWLKRRIMRFLIGVDGTSPNIDQTYIVSVTFGSGIISIRISYGSRVITGGSLYNRFGFNGGGYNALRTTFISGPSPLPYESVLKQAIDSGVLQLPFQYTYSVTIPTS